jgi:hypothetical protein
MSANTPAQTGLGTTEKYPGETLIYGPNFSNRLVSGESISGTAWGFHIPVGLSALMSGATALSGQPALHLLYVYLSGGDYNSGYECSAWCKTTPYDRILMSAFHIHITGGNTG